MTEFKLDKPINPKYAGSRDMLQLQQFCSTIAGKPVEPVKTADGSIIGFKVPNQPKQEKPKMTECNCHRHASNPAQIGRAPRMAAPTPDPIVKENAKYRELLLDLYSELFEVVAKNLGELSNTLAKKLTSEPNVSFEKTGSQLIITVSAKCQYGNSDFAKTLAKIAEMRKSIATELNIDETIEIRKSENKLDDQKERIEIYIDKDKHELFSTLIEAFKSIDGYVKSKCEQDGMSHEKICGCCNSAQFTITQDKNDFIEASVLMIYSLNKSSYNLEESAEKRIANAIDMKE